MLPVRLTWMTAVPGVAAEIVAKANWMVTGRAWTEDRLLALATAYQQATDWHTRRPEVT